MNEEEIEVFIERSFVGMVGTRAMYVLENNDVVLKDITITQEQINRAKDIMRNTLKGLRGEVNE